MVEPLSIAGTSFALLGNCVKLSLFFHSIYSQIQDADLSVQSLAIEIDSLRAVLSSVTSTFNNSSSKADSKSQSVQEYQHWQNVQDALNGCKDPLAELEKEFRVINDKTAGAAPFWRKTKKAAKLNLKA